MLNTSPQSCDRHRDQLLQGVWHCAVHNTAREVGRLGSAWPRIGQLLQWSYTVYTTFHDPTSVLQAISTSIVQGSAIGPASYVVNASDLKPVSAGNVLYKYANDTYIIIPSSNVDTRTEELDNVEQITWHSTVRNAPRWSSMTAGESASWWCRAVCLTSQEFLVWQLTVGYSVRILTTWIILSDRLLMFMPCDFFEHTAWQTPQSTW